MNASRAAAARALQLTIGSVLAATLLWKMRGSLPLPDGFSRPEAERWLLDQGPLVAAFALLRGVALVAAVYAALLGVIGLLAVVAQSSILASLTVRLTLPTLRPLIAPVAAFSLTAGTALPAGAAGFAEPRPQPPVMQVSSDAPPVMQVSSDAPPDIRGAPIMQLRPAAAAPNPAPPAVASYTVTAGDSFWSIAAETMQRATGHAASDAEVVPYWRVLIEANRDRLVVPGDPDLIYPGQVFTLPPVS